MLYVVVEIPLFRDFIQKYKRVKSLFLDSSYVCSGVTANKKLST